MRYRNFELRVRRRDASGYLVLAEAQERWEAEGPLGLDLAQSEVRDALRRLIARQTDRKFLLDLGNRLHRAIFSDPIRQLFERSFGEIEGEPNLGLRIVLRIEPPELTILPWELLYDPDCDFLATSTRSPLIRYLEVKRRIRKLRTRLPLRMLVVVPDGVDPERPLDSVREVSELFRALEDIDDCIDAKVLDGPVTYDAVEEAMEEAFDCFHFIGHGAFDDERGYLLLHGDNGAIDGIDEQRFAGLFRNRERLKLVVLNACQSAQTSPKLPFVGMAPQLVRAGVPAVVAMQYPIRDDAAVVFARRFYRALFRGEHRGRVEVAMCDARNRLSSEFPDERELAAPVLFMRTRGEVLFDTAPGSTLESISLGELARARGILPDYEINSKTDDPSPEAQDIAHRNSEQLEHLRARLAFARALALTTSGVLAVVFLAAWIGVFTGPQLFGWLAIGRITDTVEIALGGAVSAEMINPGVVQVQIPEQIDESWRQHHGELLDKLSRAGARVVAFDIYFEDDSEYDQQFSASIEDARDRGTGVIVGARATSSDGEPRVAAKIRDAASGVGILCLGTIWGFAPVAPVVVHKGSDPNKALPSLALAAYMESRSASGFSLKEGERQVLIWGDDLGSVELGVSKVTEVRGSSEGAEGAAERGCPAIRPNDLVADRYIQFSPLSTLRTYGTGFFPYQQAQYGDPESLRPYFQGKIALVGVADPQDELPVHARLGEKRFGMEIHVDAIHSLAQPQAIQPLQWQQQYLIAVVLGALAALMVFAIPARHGAWRRLAFWTVALGYVAIAVFVYLEYRLLLNTIYQIGAFALVYWAAGQVERRWWFHAR